MLQWDFGARSAMHFKTIACLYVGSITKISKKNKHFYRNHTIATANTVCNGLQVLCNYYILSLLLVDCVIVKLCSYMVVSYKCI